MGFYESKWLNEYNLNKTNFYLRYVNGILAAFDKEQDSLNVLDFLNKRHPNFKSTYTGFLLSLKSIKSFSYKISLIKYLIDTWVTILKFVTLFVMAKVLNPTSKSNNVFKYACLPFLIDKVIKKYLNYKFSSNQNQLKDKSDVYYSKLAYIGNLSHLLKINL